MAFKTCYRYNVWYIVNVDILNKTFILFLKCRKFYFYLKCRHFFKLFLNVVTGITQSIIYKKQKT